MTEIAESPLNRFSSPVAETPLQHVHAEHETVLQPTRGWISVNWRELYDGRELLFFLIWRDLKVRYKQAILGVLWVVIQPMMNMFVYTLVFGSAAGFKERLHGHQEWYGVFVYAAILPWQLFATSLSSGGLSLVNQQNIVKKIYFPRLYVPTSAVGAALVDMGISFIIVLGLMAWNHVPFSARLLFIPLLAFLALLNGLGVAYLFSALTVRYRDFRFLIPFMTQILMYASFVAFPAPVKIMASVKWKCLLMCNPMYGIVAGFRRCILPLPTEEIGFQWQFLVSSLVGGLLLLLVGIFVFRRTERTFADIA